MSAARAAAAPRTKYMPTCRSRVPDVGDRGDRGDADDAALDDDAVDVVVSG
jgi:hypothetical protein